MTRPAENSLRNARAAIDALLADAESIERIEQAAGMLAACFRAGGKVLACGNGGSACDAMHFCEELTGRFRDDRPALPAISLTDPGHLTCVGNDFGFDLVFSRAVEAYGKPGDVLVAMSTSGRSRNVVRALEAARARNLKTIALLGKDGGTLRGVADLEWVIPAAPPPHGYADRIQEVHMLILHTLIERVEQLLFPNER